MFSLEQMGYWRSIWTPRHVGTNNAHEVDEQKLAFMMDFWQRLTLATGVLHLESDVTMHILFTLV